MTLDSQKHIHFIGICGVAMSALAIACKKNGWIVTGSDAGFFPPISTELENHNINFYPGWHVEKMLKNGVPDLVVVGNVASSSNPEWTYVQEQNIPYCSYPEFIAKYIVKKNSIVCAGTYGKTSTSALLSWILTEAGLEPSYMFGGLAVNDGFDSASLTGRNSAEPWSVLEGDEYKSARWDSRPKFAHYSPNHLLLTGLSWDHADVYPTEESYMDAFRQLLRQMPKDGMVVACADDEKIKNLSTLAPEHLSTYGQNDTADYQYKNTKQTKDGISFDIVHNNATYHIESPMLGEFQAANITGCFAMSHKIGIEPTKIIETIKNFKGMKRRLEKRYEGKVTVFDDIAHSPAKAKATLETLRKIYPANKIIAIFEPNTGNRQREAIPAYDHAFAAADTVMVPTLTKIKKNAMNDAEPLSSPELRAVIAKTHPRTWNCTDDEELIDVIYKELSPGDVVVFLGSHGFRGMIEGLIEKLESRK
ncbi:MAG: Mur ligase family protein [Patescibacteria group bacterium]